MDKTKTMSKEDLWDAFENKKQISAGFVVRGKSGKILLGRSTFDKDVSWTVFKGGVENGESLLQTAIRELKEESGIDLNSDQRLLSCISSEPFYTYSVNNKIVHLFLLDDVNGILDEYTFCCSSFWEKNNPEIVDYKWFDVSEINKYVFYSQRSIWKNLCKR